MLGGGGELLLPVVVAAADDDTDLNNGNGRDSSNLKWMLLPLTQTILL